MGRLWTQSDEQRLGRAVVSLDRPEPFEMDGILFRDVVTGCVVYLVSVLLYRLRLAATPAHSVGMSIKLASDARAVQEWIFRPMTGLPGDADITGAADD